VWVSEGSGIGVRVFQQEFGQDCEGSAGSGVGV